MKTPYAHTPVRQGANTYLRRERDRRRRRELVLVVVALLPLALGLLLHTWVQLEILGAGYRINVLERDLERLRRQERELDLEAAARARPARVEEQAGRRLEMVRQTQAQTVYVEEIR